MWYDGIECVKGRLLGWDDMWTGAEGEEGASRGCQVGRMPNSESWPEGSPGLFASRWGTVVADEGVSEGSHVGLGVWAMEEPGCSQWGKAMGRFDIVEWQALNFISCPCCWVERAFQKGRKEVRFAVVKMREFEGLAPEWLPWKWRDVGSPRI